jgi:hypothetical protein
VKTVKLTAAQWRVLQVLTRKDVNTLQKHPHMLEAGKALLRACRKVVKHVEAIPKYANVRKRQTAYNRIIRVCEKAIQAAER